MKTTNGLHKLMFRSLSVLALMTIAGAAALYAEEPLTVSEPEARQAVVAKQLPEYPAIAKQMRVSGKATVQVVIDNQGKVSECQGVSGNPMLTAAAVSAVKKWSFKPFTVDGKPTKAVTHLTFSFGA